MTVGISSDQLARSAHWPDGESVALPDCAAARDRCGPAVGMTGDGQPAAWPAGCPRSRVTLPDPLRWACARRRGTRGQSPAQGVDAAGWRLTADDGPGGRPRALPGPALRAHSPATPPRRRLVRVSSRVDELDAVGQDTRVGPHLVERHPAVVFEVVDAQDRHWPLVREDVQRRLVVDQRVGVRELARPSGSAVRQSVLAVITPGQRSWCVTSTGGPAPRSGARGRCGDASWHACCPWAGSVRTRATPRPTGSAGRSRPARP